jgi:hypothetical protein
MPGWTPSVTVGVAEATALGSVRRLGQCLAKVEARGSYGSASFARPQNLDSQFCRAKCVELRNFSDGHCGKPSSAEGFNAHLRRQN